MLSAFKTTTGAVIFSALILLQANAFAAEEDEGAAMQSMQADQKTQSGIPLYSGGIGEDEANYIKSVQHEYNTKFVFTAANGEYLADLPVTIQRKGGDTVVSTVTKGPVLLVNLPDGSYLASATQNGVSREQKFTVSGHSMHIYQFRYPAADSM